MGSAGLGVIPLVCRIYPVMVSTLGISRNADGRLEPLHPSALADIWSAFGNELVKSLVESIRRLLHIDGPASTEGRRVESRDQHHP